MKHPRRLLLTGLCMAATLLSARAGSFFTDFNTGALPTGCFTNTENGNGLGAYLELNGGVGNSGCLKLTKNSNGQKGTFVLPDLDGTGVAGFDATFKVRIGGGSGNPADGMAFCVAPDIGDTSVFGEEGGGNGLRVAWELYPWAGSTPPSNPSIRVKGAGNVRAYNGIGQNIFTAGDYTIWWEDCHIRLTADGLLSMEYKGQTIVTNFWLEEYPDLINLGAPMRFAIGARTGGENCNLWIDNLQITTYPTALVGFRQQPSSQKAQQGDTILFEAQVGNTFSGSVTYQWLSNNVAIPGATSPILNITNVQASYSGSKYSLRAVGPNNTATSGEATLTVINLALPPTPQLSFDFNSGTTPAGVTLTGAAVMDTTGGIGDSGCVKLVQPAGTSAMLVADPAPTTTLYGFTARFKLLAGGGTVPPADGMAFAFGTDIPDLPGGEFEAGQGLGTGLRVTADIFNNDGIFGYYPTEGAQPAPSIDVRLGNQVLASVRMPISFMESGLNDIGQPDYMDVIVQLNGDATLNVVYHGALVYENLPIPGFGSFGASTNSTGSRFAVAVRTGGLNDNFWVDNFELTTITTPTDLRIVTQPKPQTVLITKPATFTLGLNDNTGVSFQWFRNGGAISGATGSAYSFTPVLADSGALFKAQATKGGRQVTSDEVSLTVVNLTAPTNPDVTFNFNDGLVPANTAVYGTGESPNPPGGYIAATGGVGDSGVLHLTDSVNGQQGAFVIQPLQGGAQLSAIAASFDLRLGGGSGNPADGLSFNFAPDLSDGCGGNESGNGSGLSILFDIYGILSDNPPAPYVGVRYKNALVASVQVPKPELETGVDFRRVLLKVDETGKLWLSYGDRVFFNGLQLPNYTFTTAGKFGFYGRTGGENENQWIDNITLQVTKSSGPLSVVTQPQDVLLLAGRTATFSVVVSDPVGATYQWSKNGAPISGATTASYTTPPVVLGDNGALFRVHVVGPGGSADSQNAVLTVVDPIVISNPQVSYDFNDGLVPSGTLLYSSGESPNPPGGFITGDQGVTNSGVLHLTDAVNGQGGVFIIPDISGGQWVKAFSAYWAMRLGGGTSPPADGVSFVWTETSDFGTGTFGEGGVGDNLIVNFDLWNNNGEAPSFNIFYRNALVATKKVPVSALESGANFYDVFVRLNASGTVELHYNGQVIFNKVPVPGYHAVLAGGFAWGGRTGGANENQWIDNIVVATTVGQVPIQLGYSRAGTSLELTWGAGFKLQSSPSLTTPNWQDVPGATSPWTVPTTAPAAFYRLINQ